MAARRLIEPEPIAHDNGRSRLRCIAAEQVLYYVSSFLNGEQEMHRDDSLMAFRVLVVDDDALVLMSTVMMLEDIGYTAREATSAQEAVKIIDAGAEFDLIITDHAMPGMTGAQLISVLAETYPELPVMMATGYAILPEDLNRNFVQLSKPYNERQLQAAISKAIAPRTGILSAHRSS